MSNIIKKSDPVRVSNKLVKYNSMDELREFAIILKEFIVKNDLFSKIKNKNYVGVEGWQFAGASMGLSANITNCTRIEAEGNEIRYRAEAELVDRTGHRVGWAMATCSNREHNKTGFEEYAIASMAQTRVIGKVYRNKFAFVMKMAGYEPTPAEEVTAEVVEQGQKAEPVSTLKGVAAQYEKNINEAKSAHDIYKVARAMKSGLENELINQDTYDKLTRKMEEKNGTFKTA